MAFSISLKGNYEMGFPEGSHVKASRGFRFSLWSLLYLDLGIHRVISAKGREEVMW
jgi:hypothetical protein